MSTLEPACLFPQVEARENTQKKRKEDLKRTLGHQCLQQRDAQRPKGRRNPSAHVAYD